MMDTISGGTSPLNRLVIFCIVLAFIGTLMASAVVIVAPAHSQLPTPPTNDIAAEENCNAWCGGQYTPGTADFKSCFDMCIFYQYGDV
jgi:hypothetical protein